MPRVLQYPSNLATSIADAQAGDSMEGHYGHWMLITIYQPDKSTISATGKEINEKEAGDIVLSAGASVLTPFLLNSLGVGGGTNALATTGIVGALSLGNLDEQQYQIATSGQDLTKENIEVQNPKDAANLLGRIKNAKEGRVPATRLTLGLGIKYQKSDISIALPMPKQIKTNYGFEYSETDFSSMKVINSALAFARSKLGDEKVGDKKGNPLQNTKMDLNSPDVQGMLAFLQTLPAAAIDEGGKILGLEPNILDYTRAGRNQTKIPYSEKLFKTVKRRSFDVEYTFLPKSSFEVTQIHEIIKTLKAHAHPSKGNDSYYYTTPSEFIVEFKFFNQPNSFLPKYGRLAIESIDVDYGSSDGYSALRPAGTFGSFFGGAVGSIRSSFGAGAMVSPTEINIKISFSELELLTKERIEEGY